MASRSLEVLIAGRHAGTLFQDESGALSFFYKREYRGVPLSSAMPLSTRTYKDKIIRPYLWGLLPEDSKLVVKKTADGLRTASIGVWADSRVNSL